MQKIMLFVLCVASMSAMDSEKTSRNFKKISPACYQKIQRLHNDVPRLYWFCHGCFHAVANQAPGAVPSQVCSQIVAQLQSSKMQVQDKTPYQYVNVLLLPRFKQMDDALDQKAREYGDRTRAWKWFTDEYFYQTLQAAGEGHINSLISADIATLPARKTSSIYFMTKYGTVRGEFSRDGKTLTLS